jgi:uncharacterized protein YbaR (Trm112 family)/SAM-dependent methyltransferase
MLIRPTDLVLEIGSGHNPKVRSDVLCDKYLFDDTERGGQLAVDRPLVVADGERLPFRDNAFDYVICCHVLEHSRDVARFIGEIERVGRAGYIETPSEIGEWLYGWTYHRWLVNRIGDRLVFRQKKGASPFGMLFHRLAAEDPDFARFHERSHGFLLVQHEWRRRVAYEIRDPDDAPINLNDPATVAALLAKRERRAGLNRLKTRLWGCLSETTRLRIKRVLTRGESLRRPRPDLKALVVCPRCHGEVEWHEDAVLCRQDGLRFDIRNGVPILLDPEDGRDAPM